MLDAVQDQICAWLDGGGGFGDNPARVLAAPPFHRALHGVQVPVG
jgi:hypothetical protein